MKEWIKRYKTDHQKLTQFTEKVQGILLGFNVNIDKIIEIKPNKLSQIVEKLNHKYIFEIIDNPPNTIETKEQLLGTLIHTIKEGKADERLIITNELSKWVEEEFKVKKIAIGGQAGIMANLLSDIGVKNIFLSLPVQISEFKDFLRGDIMIGEKINGMCKTAKISEIEKTNRRAITHYIFEFKKREYNLLNIKFNCPRPNRFIASYDRINSRLQIEDCFIEKSIENVKKYSTAILSGFHLANLEISGKNTFLELLQPVIDLIKKWKKRNPLLKIHVELAAVKEHKLLLTIINEIFPLIDSIGMNEQELLGVLEVLDSNLFRKVKRKINIEILYESVYWLYQNFSNLRIHLHYLGYYLVMSSPLSRKKTKKRADALISASVLAYIQAKKGKISIKSQNFNIKKALSRKGYEQLIRLEEFLKHDNDIEDGQLYSKGYIQTKEYNLTVVPTLIERNPKQLVGLGEIISVSAFLIESTE